MISSLKLTNFGNSVGIILPKEILNILTVYKGDTLYVVETSEEHLIAWFESVSKKI
ncbi:MAG: hypothetical protein ACKVOY_16670 [Burkholderiaceae bacterium]|jgi:putative addiction module antidote